MFRILLVVLLAHSVRSKNNWEDVSLSRPVSTTTDFIHRHGYSNQTHVVTTRDGYILQLHRIPHGKNQDVTKRKRVMFLMHGVESSSADWVVAGPEKALAFILADLGFDVWMGNARGNKYSRKHTKLNPNYSNEFWDFSWHEIGVIDLPTMIDYVLKVTGEKKLTYIGHSQGTTSFFVMASELPEYNEKIKVMHALAPVVYMDHVPDGLKLILPLIKTIQFTSKFFSHGEFLYSSELMARFNSLLCNEKSFITHGACNNMYSLLFGPNPANKNKTLLSDILNNFPAGCSTKQLVHFGQVIKSGKFAKFDYGELENIFRYGNMQPPQYNLKKVTAKVALYVGLKDNLGTPKDVEKLAGILPNVVEHYRVPHQDFNHIDFLYATQIRELLCKKLFEIIDKFI